MAVLKNLDHYPIHYIMHVMHGSEIIGYKWPEPVIRAGGLNSAVRFVPHQGNAQEVLSYSLLDAEGADANRAQAMLADRPGDKKEGLINQSPNARLLGADFDLSLIGLSADIPLEPENMKNYTYRISGIRSSKEFAKKGLAQYAVNVGLRCGHDCTYCSSRATLRRHAVFKELGQNAFGTGYSIVDPDIADKVAEDARRMAKRGMVQVCTTVDAWAPEAKALDLGRRCLEALLAQPDWTVRILTKNAAVAEDYDLIRKHKDRVLVGLSLTGTADKEEVLSVIEPNASRISERMSALEKAHKIGLRTYGMLCPLLPGIADAPEQIDELVRFVKGCGAEEVFCEPVNARGNSLTLTEEVLRAKGFVSEFAAIAKIRKRKYWSPYTLGLIRNTQASMRKHLTISNLRFLLYPGRLTEQDKAQIHEDAAGVIWLKSRSRQRTIETVSEVSGL